MNKVIYFESKINPINRGFFKRIDKNGFYSVNFLKNARIFKSDKNILKNYYDLLRKEGDFYNFYILEVLKDE